MACSSNLICSRGEAGVVGGTSILRPAGYGRQAGQV